jgi:hypothetical protein
MGWQRHFPPVPCRSARRDKAPKSHGSPFGSHARRKLSVRGACARVACNTLPRPVTNSVTTCCYPENSAPTTCLFSVLAASPIGHWRTDAPQQEVHSCPTRSSL